MRSKLPLLGVIIVLAAGYMAAQPFRHGGSQPTAHSPTAPQQPLRWNEPVPLQVTSSSEASPASAPQTFAETQDRPSFDRIPRIQAGGDFAALADPPPNLAPRYTTPEPSPAAEPQRQSVATVSREEPEREVFPTSPVAWPNAPRTSYEPERVASLPPRDPIEPQAGAPRIHRVVDGDSLPQLAERYLGNAARYLEIYEANRDLLASPDLLPLGVKLVIPPAGGAVQQQTSAQAPTHPPPGASSGLVPIGGA